MAVPLVRPTVRPSGWWYLATVGIGALGLLVGLALAWGGVRGSRAAGSESTRVPLGRAGLVTFVDDGDYTLSYEGPVQATTSADVARLASAVKVDLRPEGGGRAVRFAAYQNEQAIVSQAGQQWVPLSTFHIDRPGTYTLRSVELPDVTGDEANIVVGRSPYSVLARGGLAGLAAIGVGALMALIATVALAVTRGRSRRALGPVRSWPAPGLVVPGGGPWPWVGPPPQGPPPGWGAAQAGMPVPPPGYGPAPPPGGPPAPGGSPPGSRPPTA